MGIPFVLHSFSRTCSQLFLKFPQKPETWNKPWKDGENEEDEKISSEKFSERKSMPWHYLLY